MWLECGIGGRRGGWGRFLCNHTCLQGYPTRNLNRLCGTVGSRIRKTGNIVSDKRRGQETPDESKMYKAEIDIGFNGQKAVSVFADDN